MTRLNIKRKNGPVTKTYLENLLRHAVKDMDEPMEYEGQAVVAVLKAMFEAEKGSTVVLIEE